ELASLVAVTNELLARFHERYVERKAERGYLDYNDLELLARRVLDDREQQELPPPLGEDLYLLVDEFQDTNDLQGLILDRLRPARVLAVGDERQSIYRFRGADVGVFKRRANDLAGHTGGKEGLRRLDLNYRSSQAVLDFINHLFSREGFFGSEHVRLDYGRYQVSSSDELARETAAGCRPTTSITSTKQYLPAVEVLVVSRSPEPPSEGAAAESEAPSLSTQEA
ncbi:MAG: UvrD-helicase domain-containing protein, partial [Thermoleophilia bacterium]|nr:UvrD-helicase domain-containing protein [Thermoleophilia bacterium]